VSDIASLIGKLASVPARKGFRGYWNMPEVKVTWAFEAGLPDPATFPVDDLLRISESVLRTDSAAALQYGGAQHGGIIYGYEGLRDLLAERARREGVADVDRSGVMLTSGGIQAITMACRAFLDPGDVLAVEAPTWGAVLSAAATQGAEAVAIPMDREGLLVDELERRLAQLRREGRRLKLLYTIATFNTPTGISLSEARRRRVLELARQWEFVVLEDNVYGDLRYEGDPIPSMLSLDDSGLVLKIDSFSKTLAPGLRLGWVTGHPEAIGALSSVRGDLGVSQWTARIMARYLEEGLYDPHIASVNRLYRDKRDATEAGLRDSCSPWVTWRTPAGGFFVWVELGEEVDGAAVMQKALADGVVCRPGERFFGDEESGRQMFRIAFSQVPESEIERGIGVLGKAIVASVR
jgi:2-aminoadipate transaminase